MIQWLSQLSIVQEMPGAHEWMLLLMPVAGMVSAFLVMALAPTQGVHGRRRRERDLEAATRPSRLCPRRVPRGLARLEKAQARNEQLLKQRSDADAADNEAVSLEVASLSGKSWSVTASVRTTGAELRARIAELAEVPSIEVLLLCGVDILANDEVPLLTKADVLRGPPPQLQMVRSRQQHALSGSSDGSLKLWKVGSDKFDDIATLRGHKARVNCLAVDWKQRIALSGSSDGCLKLWDLDAQSCIDTLGDRESDIKCLSVNWSKRLALASDVHVLRLWDMETAACLATFRGHGCEIYAMGADWGAMLALSGSFEGQVCMWRLQEPSRHLVIHQHLACVTCIAMDAKSRQALSGSNDGLLKKWNTESLQCTMNMQGGWGVLRCLSVNWPEEQAITGSEVGVLNHWDLLEGVCLRRIHGESVGLFDGINAIQLDWSTINAVTGGTSGQVKLWHLGEEPSFLAQHMHGAEIRCISIDAPEPEPREDYAESSQSTSSSDAEPEETDTNVAAPESLPCVATSSHEVISDSKSEEPSPGTPPQSRPPAADSTESNSALLEIELALEQERRRRRWMATVTVGLFIVGAVGMAFRRRWRRR